MKSIESKEPRPKKIIDPPISSQNGTSARPRIPPTIIPTLTPRPIKKSTMVFRQTCFLHGVQSSSKSLNIGSISFGWWLQRGHGIELVIKLLAQHHPFNFPPCSRVSPLMRPVPSLTPQRTIRSRRLSLSEERPAKELQAVARLLGFGKIGVLDLERAHDLLLWAQPGRDPGQHA